MTKTQMTLVPVTGEHEPSGQSRFSCSMRSVNSIFLAAVAIAMIVIGAMYFDDCPAQRFIPIYLVVAGATHFIIIPLIMLPACLFWCTATDEESAKEKFKMTACIILLFTVLIGLFSFAWFIAGSVWTYGLKGKWSSEKTAGNYCHPTVYYFAFWKITFTYIIIGVQLLVSLCYCLKRRFS